MAFERIELAVAKAKAPAGITITQLGKTVVALRKDIVARAGFKASGTFSAMVGTDDDHGKLRIVKDKDGVACARELKKTGAFFFNLGMVPAIGVTPHKQRAIEARLVDDGVEFDIPPDDGPKLLAPPEKMVAERPLQAIRESAPKPKDTPKPGGVTFHGVTIDTTLDSESISFKGKSTEVTTRQAKLLQLLARPRPAPVAETFLIANLWDGKPPQTAADQLRTMADDLRAGLAPIGLSLNLVKGAGYQLKDR
jgi:hypothetical protein